MFLQLASVSLVTFFISNTFVRADDGIIDVPADDSIVDFADLATNSSRRVLSERGQADVVSQILSLETDDGPQQLNLSVGISECGGLRKSARIGQYIDSRGVVHENATVRTVENDVLYMQRLGGTQDEQMQRYSQHIVSQAKQVIRLGENIFDMSIARNASDSDDEVFHDELRRLLWDRNDIYTAIIGSHFAGALGVQAFLGIRYPKAILSGGGSILNSTAASLSAKMQNAELDKSDLKRARDLLIRLGAGWFFMEWARREFEAQERYGQFATGWIPISGRTANILLLAMMPLYLGSLYYEIVTVANAVRARQPPGANSTDYELAIPQEAISEAVRSLDTNGVEVSAADEGVQFMPFSEAERLVHSDQCPNLNG